MKILQELITESINTGNSEWVILTKKAIADYCGDNEIYAKENNLFMYLTYDEEVVKLANVKTLFKEIVECYDDEGRTKYPGDKLRKYVANEIYNSLKEEDTVSDLIKLLGELSE